ncbi:MAG: cytochrome b N-terminal domain-containing protein [Candidatus Binataceae bacterium]|nr:cytochrome b N-terminal domain-containing protein [Candidatus Binataceae bacterium]
MRTLLNRLLDAFEERTGLFKLLGDLARHPVPPGTGWWYVFGSATLMCFIVQVVTGIALATRYIASTGSAYEVLQFITNDAFLGHLLRGMHFFGASLMVLMVGIHMAQVFLMGCYKYPREFNWITGVLLLFLVIAMGFTGQLLRWDQTAVWATVVAAEQIGRLPIIGQPAARFLLGGKTLSGATLSRFFAFHVFFIPAMIFGLLAIHLYLVIHDGISEPPVPGQPVDPKTYRSRYEKLLKDRGEAFWPDVAWRDVIFMTGVVGVIVLLAIFIGPPKLGGPPNPSLLASDPRPDWYLTWYFAVLALLPHSIESAFMVLAPVIVVIWLLLVPVVGSAGERHPKNRPWAVAAVVLIVVTIVSFWIEGRRSPWSPDFGAKPLPVSVIGAASGPIFQGAQLFHERGCEFCHNIGGNGGERGPNLTYIGDRLTANDITIRIMNGGYNMPAFAGILKPQELDDLVAFLRSRKHAPAEAIPGVPHTVSMR